MKSIAKFLLAIALVFGTAYGALSIVNVYATLKVVQSPKIYLYSGLSASAVSMRITPYPKDLNGTKLTFSDLGDTPTVTVDPGLLGIEEIIMISAMTDNGDNTATLTISGRNLTSKYPYTTTGTGRQHGSGAVVVFSNNPQIYGRLASPENIASISALWTYLVSPVVPTPTTEFQAATKGYADSLTIAGTPVAGTSTGGRVQIGTGLQAASSTALGTATGNPYLALTTSIATSTYGNGSTSGLKAVITQNDGKIDSNFIRQSDKLTWTGGTMNTASTTFTATTTISASSVTNNALVLNGVPMQAPSTQGAANTVWINNGSGVYTSTTTSAYLGSASFSTLYSGAYYVSASVPSGTNFVHINAYCVAGISTPSGTYTNFMVSPLGMNTSISQGFWNVSTNGYGTMSGGYLTASTTASVVGLSLVAVASSGGATCNPITAYFFR